MLVSPGGALLRHRAGSEPRQLLCSSRPWFPSSAVPIMGGEGRAALIGTFGFLTQNLSVGFFPPLQPGSLHLDKAKACSCLCQLDP